MAGASSVAGEVFVDALPYFDQGYDAPGVREAVSTQHTSARVQQGVNMQANANIAKQQVV